MKIFHQSVFILSFLTGIAQAATYTSNFSGLAAGAILEGVDGWTQNYANDFDGSVTYPWAYGDGVITSAPGDPVVTIPAAAVGGYYSTFTPPGGSFYAAHELSMVKGMLFEMNFAIGDSTGFYLDEDPVLYGTKRNPFKISFYDQAYEVFSLVFEPNINPTAVFDTNDTWNFSSSSGGTPTADLGAVFEDQLYNFRLSILPKNGNFDYFYSVTSGDSRQNGQGILTGLTGKIDELRIGIDATEGEFGTNQLLFEGITAAVPEPSTCFLALITAGGMMFRRLRK